MADIQEIEANGTVYEIAVKSTSKVNGLSTELSNINDSIDSVSGDVDAVSGRVDTAEQDISDLTARVNNLQSIGRFLAMWDADTGIARYLEAGFVYEQGDYFIIAQVGNPNFMPTGASYTGASTTVTTDPIEVSDMFFYDGTRWIYLPNHQRQIAVDEALSTTSTNPVENRVVTAALNGKQDTLTEDNAGTGISIVDGVISNTQTSAEWGKITGNLNDQLDLKKALDNAGGGINGSITWLDTRNVTMFDDGDGGYSDQNYDHDKQFKGDYADIIFQLSGGKDYLIENKDNINICINRFSRCRHNGQEARNIRKYRIITDSRIKTDFTMYCYKVINPDSQSFEYDETQNRYFYTTGRYEDGNMGQLIADDPAIYLYRGIGNVLSGTNNLSGWASSLDNLYDPGLGVTDITDEPGQIMRCPEHDINEVNQTKALKEREAFKKMRCREYNVDGKTYYYYALSWQQFANVEDTEDVYVARKLNEEGEEVPLEKFVYEPGRETEDMGISLMSLGLVGEIIDPHTPFVRHPEFDWYWWAFDSEQDMMNAIIETSEAGEEESTPNAYVGDYPVKPVRLADCSYLNTKNRIIKHEEGTEEEWEETLAQAGQYLSFKWTLFEHPEWIQDEEELTFRLPYDTYHLNMRFQGFQKSAMAQDINEKNNIMRAMGVFPNPTKWGGAKGGVHSSNHARLTEALQFYTKTNDDVRFGRRPKTNIINKKLTVVLFTEDDGEGGKVFGSCKQTLL